MENKDYFEHQIKGLILIIKQEECDPKEYNPMVARSYVIEKLNMILADGIGFHSSILEKLKDGE